MSAFVGWMRIFEMFCASLNPMCFHDLAGVGRLVDAVAGHDVAADARLARADEHDVRVALRHRDGADRGAGDLPVGDRRPRLAAIGRLPESASGRAEVADVRLALDAGSRNRPSAAVRTDAAPLIRGQQSGIESDARRRLGADVSASACGDRRNEHQATGRRTAEHT